ncbi:aminotransferase class V-fold PLP-dependent enzyme [Flagellimonas hymeniacidonis]|uniref:Aminotransferase class V-fold PLP-dependent enzyme n=1 Tax=Flagellimonas hymeniacidonis TaxID=2603628 RepID=A0A5C8V0P3_9FLAO|nr:aminotransferase class V-fold PLP-dependent enzyme [Flagellimonas hymeniacidonis]TXN34971.1 aminotransferase class V-fold PLP-dependent enzyme [Flagellimonas hymeniacidonis]
MSSKNRYIRRDLEAYFGQFKIGVIGERNCIKTPNGIKHVIYSDWIASGRLYDPIEHAMQTFVGPMVANTHSFSSETGKASTYAYRYAREIIREHVNANKEDILVTTGTGMTGALVRLQRIMGLRDAVSPSKKSIMPDSERPVVFITHMEHHSNHVSWMETSSDVVIVPCGENGQVSPLNLEKELVRYKDRKVKIGAFTACSNVTGTIVAYRDLARLMHRYDGYCIMDFAASAPYVDIDMHPADPEERLDAVLFSPHKFLGGPGSCGVLVFNKALYKNEVPDVPGGGNVRWTDPWGNYAYFDDIETREDGGTPGFLQTIRAAMAIRLKEKMGVRNMEKREGELLASCFQKLSTITGLKLLGSTSDKRIGCVSFTVKGIHYNLMVRLLNDRFGIQVRGGWSCASTYGHHLLGLDREASKRIMEAISNGDLTNKPGWVRLSLHPIMTDIEVNYICGAIFDIVKNIDVWGKEYRYNSKTNEFEHLDYNDRKLIESIKGWFD